MCEETTYPCLDKHRFVLLTMQSYDKNPMKTNIYVFSS